ATVTCDPQFAYNSIKWIEVHFQNLPEYGWSEVDYGPGPQNVEARVQRGPGYCLPDSYTIPLPIPDPVGDPQGSPGGCEVEHAKWHPSPVIPGKTISIWGGGNVSEFPLPLATSYWTTVDGKW